MKPSISQQLEESLEYSDSLELEQAMVYVSVGT